jgi:hypothetical protein
LYSNQGALAGVFCRGDDPFFIPNHDHGAWRHIESLQVNSLFGRVECLSHASSQRDVMLTATLGCVDGWLDALSAHDVFRDPKVAFKNFS